MGWGGTELESGTFVCVISDRMHGVRILLLFLLCWDLLSVHDIIVSRVKGKGRLRNMDWR